MTEKPTGDTYDEIKQCYETAEKYNKVLVTGYQRFVIVDENIVLFMVFFTFILLLSYFDIMRVSPTH